MKISKREIESLARCLLPEMQKYFESEEGRRELKNRKERECEEEKGKKNEFRE